MYKRQALDYAKDKDIAVIPAAEIFVSHKGKLLHMLGYGIDIKDAALNEEIAKTVSYTHLDVYKRQLHI